MDKPLSSWTELLLEEAEAQDFTQEAQIMHPADNEHWDTKTRLRLWSKTG